YLLGEVLERQPTDMQDFLLETSILPELNASLCDAITGRDDSHRLLRALEAQNLFVLPLDASRQSFRYHHLFAELLQSELRARDRGAWRAAHRRASDWFVGEGRPSEALEHLFAADFHDEALDLLIGNAADFYDRTQVAEMLQWLERFPKGYFDTRPKRMLDLAMVLGLGGRYAEAARCLEHVEATLSSAEHPDEVQQARLAGHWALWSHLVADAPRSISWANKAIDLY